VDKSSIVSKNQPQPALLKPQLIVGLGNPGAQYDRTRHNIGFEVVDALGKRWQVPLAENRKFQGYFGEGFIARHKVRLLKPSTFMNLSGQSIRSILDWYKLDPIAVLVVYDDMDLPVGRLRLRLKGSAGGHNGMKSTIAHLGTQDFPRLRLGIGSPRAATQRADPPKGETISHVLGKFAPQEREPVQQAIDQALNAIETIYEKGIETAMNRFN
jgi:PTH1 family peptidyl-tRNA hydrolase